MAKEALRYLPSVDRLLAMPGLQRLAVEHGQPLVTAAVRETLQEARSQVLGGAAVPTETELAAAAAAHLAALVQPTLRPVINATGVVVHTNLGRAPLSAAAQAAMQAVAAGYSNLEYDLAAGQRGSRDAHAADLLCRLSGAEAALVVNNNAAAVLLMLAALARGREVIISRGQLVEIGGGFRIPEVMAASGATLVEVGTTNRTYVADYAAALTEDTAALLLVHSSNFRIVGFTHEASLAELAGLARDHGVLLLYDLGSGSLLDTGGFGIGREPGVQDAVQGGADLISFSGDKLLGGPQAGLIVGRREVVARLAHHPLARALRVDKTRLAALQATLLAYLQGRATQEIPIWQMIAAPLAEVTARATAWAAYLAAAGLAAGTLAGESTVGGGSLPGETFPTCLLALSLPSPDQAAARLRRGSPPVIARIEDERLLFDPRTVLAGQDEAMLAAILAAGAVPS